MQPPAQELGAKDLHDASWTFRHIYRGYELLLVFLTNAMYSMLLHTLLSKCIYLKIWLKWTYPDLFF